MKICKKCNQEKELTDFYANKKSSDGRIDSCKVCFKIWQNDNKEKILAYRKEYYKLNKEKSISYYKENRDRYLKQMKEYNNSNKDKNKTYRIINKEEIALKKREWYQANKEKCRDRYKEKYVEYHKEYYKKNKERMLEQQKQRIENKKDPRANLTVCY